MSKQNVMNYNNFFFIKQMSIIKMQNEIQSSMLKSFCKLDDREIWKHDYFAIQS